MMSVNTDERIVRAMAELLRVQGYAATGIKQLAEAAGAPVGSIYHHFRGGKEEVAAAALRSTGAVYIQLLPMLLDPYDELSSGLEAVFVTAADDLAATGWANLCPVGTVAGEVADTHPGLREVAAEVIDSWVDQGSTYLRHRGLSEADARDLIQAVLGALEGGFILARTQRSGEPLVAAGRAMAAFAARMPPGEPTSARSLYRTV